MVNDGPPAMAACRGGPRAAYTAAMPPKLPHDALILAPMVALSHRALRELALEFGGLDLAYTEMASAGAAVSGAPYEECYFDSGPAPEKVVYQLYTAKQERLVEALAMLRGLPAAGAGVVGAPGAEVFGADINFGCAAPQITRAGGGAAWMREPERAFELVRAARSAWDRSLSAKIRLGQEEDYGRLADFVRGLAEAGIDYVAVHPRLEGQKFRRAGRWDFVAKLAAEMPVPIVGSGDVRGWGDYRRRIAETGGAGIMIGREAVRRPWIFALIRGKEKDPDFSIEVDLREVALRMLELIESRLVGDFRLTRAQRFFFYYAENFSYAHYIKWKLVNSESLEAMRRELESYFEEMPGDRLRRYAD
jgi:tRNA-dihydrouridine synthase B